MTPPASPPAAHVARKTPRPPPAEGALLAGPELRAVHGPGLKDLGQKEAGGNLDLCVLRRLLLLLLLFAGSFLGLTICC